MPGPLVGSEQVVLETIVPGPNINPFMGTAKQIALLAKAFPPQVNTFIATAVGDTLTAIGIISGFITRSGPTANFTDVTDSAPAIIGALPPEAPFNTSWLLFINNTTPYTESITPGTGVTLVGLGPGGIVRIPANSTAVFQMAYTGADQITMTGMVVSSNSGNLGSGMSETDTHVTTVGDGLLPAAGIVGGVITRSGPTNSYTDTVDSASNIIAALPNPVVGQSWELAIVNLNPYPATLAAGTGITFLPGTARAWPGDSTSRILVSYTGPNQISMKLLGSSLLPQAGAQGLAPVALTGTLSRMISGTGVVPGSIGNDNVLAVYSLPANVFDVAGRGVRLTAMGSLGPNANNKRIKIIFNPTSAVVGSAVAGGTTVEDTGVITTSGATGGWSIVLDIFKVGANGSNTQIATSTLKNAGGGSLGVGPPVPCAAVENSPILICVTGNASVLVGDIALFSFHVEWIN